MNEVVKAILSRRSIRTYEQKQIKEEELQTIIEAGMYSFSSLSNYWTPITES
ncbi:MAG: nitroreductase family protein [Thermincolia bacterium]